MIEKFLLYLLSFFGYVPEHMEIFRNISLQDVTNFEELKAKGIKEFCKSRGAKSAPRERSSKLHSRRLSALNLVDLWEADVQKDETGKFEIDFACWLLEVSPDKLYQYRELDRKLGMGTVSALFATHGKEQLEQLVRSPLVAANKIANISAQDFFLARKLSRTTNKVARRNILLDQMGLSNFKLPTLLRAHLKLTNNDLKAITDSEALVREILMRVSNKYTNVEGYKEDPQINFLALTKEFSDIADNLAKAALLGMGYCAEKDITQAVQTAMSLLMIGRFQEKIRKVKETKIIPISELVINPLPPETPKMITPPVEKEQTLYKIKLTNGHQMFDYIMPPSFALNGQAAEVFSTVIPGWYQLPKTKEDPYGETMVFPDKDIEGKRFSSVHIFKSDINHDVGPFIGAFRCKVVGNGSIRLEKSKKNNQPTSVMVPITPPKELSILENTAKEVVITFSREEYFAMKIHRASTIILYDSHTSKYMGEWTTMSFKKSDDEIRIKPTKNSSEYSRNACVELHKIVYSGCIQKLIDTGEGDVMDVDITENENTHNPATIFISGCDGITGDITDVLFIQEINLYRYAIACLSMPGEVILKMGGHNLGRYMISEDKITPKNLRFQRINATKTTTTLSYTYNRQAKQGRIPIPPKQEIKKIDHEKFIEEIV